MTELDQIALTAGFKRWFRGCESAARLAALVTEVAHVCDDLIDVDRDLLPATIARSYRVMLLEIPSNTFYRENFDFIQPLLAMVWLQWSASCVMEREQLEGDREKSYMLRAGLYGLYHGIATIVGGLDWAESIGPDIYRSYGEKLENFDA